MNIDRFAISGLLTAWLAGCGDGGGTTDAGNQGASSAGDGAAGSSDLIVAPGNGAASLRPGTGAGDISDGWTVQYDRLIVTLGDVYAHAGSTSSTYAVDSSGGHIVDLTRLPADGVRVGSRDNIQAYVYETTEFTTPVLTESDRITFTSSQEDYDLMVVNGYTIYIEGTIARDSGQSCSPAEPTECTPAPLVAFAWGLVAPTLFSGCNGFSVPENGRGELVLTLPGDRWFLLDFSAEAGRGDRNAQWIADADLDRDGETTLEELRQIPASALFDSELGYDLTAAPIAVETAYDFLAAQIRTIGLDSANGCALATPTD